MNPPSPPGRLRTIAGAAVVTAVAAVGILLWMHGRASVPASDIEAFLGSTAGAGQLRFDVGKVEALGKGASGMRVSVAATARPLQPLYSRADTADYLRRTFQLDPDSTADARRLLADKSAARSPAYAPARPFPPDPFLATVLQTESPADAAYAFKGVVDARGGAGAWSLSLVSGGFEGAAPKGEPRASFGGPTFIAGDAKDDATLRSQAADLQAFADRVAAIRSKAEAAHAAAVGVRRAALLSRIAPGRVFAGKALESGEQNGTALYLEIAGVSSGGAVTALLRNEGGWHNTRAFQGTWAADDEATGLALELASSAGQAVRNAGPFLENTQNWTLSLSMDPAGSLSGQTRNFQYRFQPVLPAMVPALKGRLEAEFEGAVAATEPGTLYQGTATSAATGKSEPVLLRFANRSADGKTTEASIESANHPWKRALHGYIVDNTRRSGGEPVRLRTAAKEAVEDAPADSALGDQEDLELSLGVRDGTIAGEDSRFTYQLAATGETDLHKLEAARMERARSFRNVVRQGIAYDGTLREDQGFITHARLEFSGVDPKTGAVTASIHSLARSGVYRDFAGSCDPSGGSVSLGATGRGAYGEAGSFDAPFLVGPAPGTLHLELIGTSIIGRIEGNPHWTMEFAAATFLSAPTEAADAGSPPADGSVFPAFPKAAGAYLLDKGAWAPLPRNQGHVVEETIRPKSELRLPPSIVGAVNAGLAEFTKEKAEKRKVTYLEFPGKDPRPVSAGPAIVILFVGPELQGKPPVELALADVQKDGQRWIEVQGSSQTEVRLGEQRVAAYVRRIAPGAILFTTTSAPAPGSYVFNADAGYELTQE